MALDTGVVPTGYTGASAIATIQEYAGEYTYPATATVLAFMNKGLEEIVREVGGIKLWAPYYTNNMQTTVAFNNDVQDVRSCNFSMGSANASSNGSSSPFAQGALVYPTIYLEEAAFMDACAGFPAVGFGPPQALFIYSDFGSAPGQTLPAPAQVQLAVTSGTSNGAEIEVGVTYVNANGETILSAVADVTPTTIQQGQAITPPSYQNATSYNIYAGAVGGPYHLQNVSPIALGTPYTIPYPLSTGTATPPVTNTATGAGTGGSTYAQMYPAAMIGQLNIYYRARPLLFADTSTNSWTNLDTSVQEAAIIWAVSRVLMNRQRAAEAKEIWLPMLYGPRLDGEGGMLQSLKESINRRTVPKSGQVRDVTNRSFPNSPYWMTS